MKDSSRKYRVGLFLSKKLEIADYELSVSNQKCEVYFHNNTGNENKYSDLIITDKNPNDLEGISYKQKDCHGTVLVINTISNPTLESKYESIFKKAIFLKYKSLKNISNESITRSINAEFIKSQVNNDKLGLLHLLFNKHTRGDLLNRVLDLGWLLVPFFLIILYLIGKYICNHCGYYFSFLCWFADYKPDCKDDIYGELKLLVILYSLFNLMFYYDYVLSIFDNINNDVFQFNFISKHIHKRLQFYVTIILFASTLIILKAIFAFKYNFIIDKEYGIKNFSLILDSCIPYLKDHCLIYYFFLLDGCLWLITRNFSKTISNNSIPFSSHRQNEIIKEAQKSFRYSTFFDFTIWGLTIIVINPLIADPQGTLAIQLILLQAVYLYLNFLTILHDFKYK